MLITTVLLTIQNLVLMNEMLFCKCLFNNIIPFDIFIYYPYNTSRHFPT